MVGLTASADNVHSSVGVGRSKAITCSSLSRLPEYTSGSPSGSIVTEPLMMSPVSNGGMMSSPVS